MNSLSVITVLCVFVTIPFSTSLGDDAFGITVDSSERDAESSAADSEETDQIIGGGFVPFGGSNYMAALIDPSNGAPFCAGTLYKARYILTAGHCVYGRPLTSIKVLLKSVTINPAELGALFIYPQKITIMPGMVYTSNQVTNDIAVIDLGTYYAPVLSRIPSVALGPYFPEPTYTGSVGLVFGWGSPNGGFGYYSNQLRGAQVLIMDNTVCQNSMVNLSIGSGMMCATSSLSGSTCFGDDGGPMLVGAMQVGIAVKTPYPCGSSTSPTMYIRIGSYAAWIASVTP